jgi:hypothetical protein
MTMASETSRLVDHNLSVKTVSWLKFIKSEAFLKGQSYKIHGERKYFPLV